MDEDEVVAETKDEDESEEETVEETVTEDEDKEEVEESTETVSEEAEEVTEGEEEDDKVEKDEIIRSCKEECLSRREKC